MEKIMKPMSGFIVLFLALVLIGLGIYFIVIGNPGNNDGRTGFHRSCPSFQVSARAQGYSGTASATDK